MENKLIHNPHPGEILKYEFLEELELSQNDLASAIDVPYLTIQEIIQTKISITADIDLRLCRYFRLSEGYFLRLQNAYELMEAKRKLGETLNKIIPHAAAWD
ncbi:HigA family addiction module antitoxin [Limnofasciculus baicalensis]|uniref:HigA family addiction module antitoxin n=1 Tax=Limnofasciculus baicalensis BBK-W-15 TaxID=2699891 RepID=A0AAE3GW06_9CYAN|nr:HigA family addiction module antitoxin [Limnofasciculus baicalensis]MCP2730913.1 HigA family addiction module antitoxin [Limnofasciculus baicalensis BBK-W-15]